MARGAQPCELLPGMLINLGSSLHSRHDDAMAVGS